MSTPEAFDQSLPFHNHVAAIGEKMVPQPGGAVGIGVLLAPEAVGAGVPADAASTGGIKVVVERDEPEPEEPEDGAGAAPTRDRSSIRPFHLLSPDQEHVMGDRVIGHLRARPSVAGRLPGAPGSTPTRPTSRCR